MIEFDHEKYVQDWENCKICQLSVFVVKHWIPIVVTTVVLILIRTIFNHVIFPIYYENFKKWIGLERKVAEMKEVLELDYSDLWHESEFCMAFLELQDDHQKLIRFSKSDANGENPKRFHWANKYSKINLK